LLGEVSVVFSIGLGHFKSEKGLPGGVAGSQFGSDTMVIMGTSVVLMSLQASANSLADAVKRRHHL